MTPTSPPSHLQYSADHEWIDATASPARIGITDLATRALGDIVFLDLPAVGTQVTVSQPCGEVESTKSVSDLVAPVSGIVVAVNDAALANPSLVDADPFGDGWLFAVTVSALGPMMSAEQYERLNGDAR
jgi:glycine cleavage system H protein